jgi:hypothetical protein
MVPPYVLLVTVKVKVKKAHYLFIEMCHDTCHILYSNIFNPHSMQCVSEEEKKLGQENGGKSRGHKRSEKSSKSKMGGLG